MEQATLEPHAPKQDKRGPQVRHSFSHRGTDWVIMDDGHYKPLRVGEIEPGVRVHLTIRGLEHRQGNVMALVPGYGPKLPVSVVVELDPPKTRDPRARPRTVIRHYRPDQLKVIKPK